MKKKKVRVKIMIIIIMMMMIIIIIIIIIIIKKQKRVSQTFKVRNSSNNDGIENQRALRACSFMLWFKFILISRTC